MTKDFSLFDEPHDKDKNKWDIVFNSFPVVKILNKDVFPLINGMIRLFLCPIYYYNDDFKNYLLIYIIEDIYKINIKETLIDKEDIIKLYYRIILQFQKNVEIYNFVSKYSLKSYYDYLKFNIDVETFLDIEITDKGYRFNKNWMYLLDIGIFSLDLIKHFSNLSMKKWKEFDDIFIQDFYLHYEYNYNKEIVFINIESFVETKMFIYNKSLFLLKFLNDLVKINKYKSYNKLITSKKNILRIMDKILNLIITDIVKRDEYLIFKNIIYYINETIVISLIINNIITNYDKTEYIEFNLLYEYTKYEVEYYKKVKNNYSNLLKS